MPRAAGSKKVSRGWIRTEADKAAIAAGCYFDPDAAAHVCNFFPRYLRHSVGRFAGRRFELEPWEVDYLSRLYGWRRPDGTRRFRESYLEISKKNGKSSMAAGLALYGLFEEPGAEVFQGAKNRKQAAIIYREASRMVAASPELRRVLKVHPSKNTITFAQRNARLKTLSADADSEDGANSSLTILDELHRFGNTKLYDVMKYAGAARHQPLLLSFTTAGQNRRSLCWELRERARKIIEGSTEDLYFLGVIYAADPDDDLDDPATWRKANPSLGSIISESEFAAELVEAKRIPRKWVEFLRLRLGIWSTQATRWLSLDLWDNGADEVGLDWWIGQDCYAALDLSSVKDLTSLTLIAEVDGGVRLRSFFFIPEETAQARAEEDDVPYPTWIQDGEMFETTGNATDHDAIRLKLNDMVEQGINIQKVGIDPWNAAHLTRKLQDDGFDVQLIRQGYGSLSGPSKELERLLLAGKVRHEGNRVMRWCVENTATEEDAAGNIKPSKKKSTERIDGVVSAVMGVCLAMTFPNEGASTFTVFTDD